MADGIRSEHGAAAVEFAIVAMLLVTLLVGIMEFGYAFFAQGGIASAARAGARSYAIDPNAADAKDAAVGAAPMIGLETGMVSIDLPHGLVQCTPGADVTVTIEYPYGGLTGFFTFMPAHLTGQAKMRCGG